MTTIKILGGGCAKCKQLEKLTGLAFEKIQAENAAFDGAIEKVTDMVDIMDYAIMSTPALVINEKVYSQGNLPSVDEIVGWLGAL